MDITPAAAALAMAAADTEDKTNLTKTKPLYKNLKIHTKKHPRDGMDAFLWFH